MWCARALWGLWLTRLLILVLPCIVCVGPRDIASYGASNIGSVGRPQDDDFLGEGIKCKGQNGDEGADETNMAVTASVLSTQLVVGIVARWWNVRHTVLHEVQGA